MKQIVEYPLEKGGSVLIEVELPESTSGITRAGREEGLKQVRQSFESALAQVKPAIEAVVDTLQGLGERPDEFAVEFGIALKGETSALIASTSTEANFKATLTWKRK